MPIDKKHMLLMILSTLTLLLAGCQSLQEPMEVVFEPMEVIFKPPSAASKPRETMTPKRFEESAVKGPTPVESAIQMSEKYAKKTEELSELRRKCQDLIAENKQLKEQLAPCRAQLKQAKKELDETNNLLIEMTVELNNWKVDVLGYRDEMRNADKAQLDVLCKILEILGGEAQTESTRHEDSDTASSSESG